MRRRLALLVFGIVVLVGIAHPAGAELRIEVERRTVVASPTDPVEGFFDVFFRIVEPDEGRNDLAGFDLVINLPPPEDGITFGNAQLTESPHPPVFPGIPPITFPNGSNQLRVQSFLFAGATAIDHDEGLVRVPFEVAPGIEDLFPLTIETSMTMLRDNDIAVIEYVPTDGWLRVLPEPVSLWSMLVAALPLLGRRRSPMPPPAPRHEVEPLEAKLMLNGSDPVLSVADRAVESDPVLAVSAFVDVVFEVPAGATPMLGGYDTILALSPATTDIVFTGASEAPAAVFAGQTPAAAGGATLQVQDILPLPFQEAPILDGAGLFRATFEVAAGTTGNFEVRLDSVNLVDGNGVPIGFTGFAGMLTVTPSNLPPVTETDAYRMLRGDALDVPAAAGVLENDRDEDFDPFDAVVEDLPAHGALELDADGAFRYVPEPDFTGVDAFTYVARDAFADSEPTRVEIDVIARPTISIEDAIVDEALGPARFTVRLGGLPATGLLPVPVEVNFETVDVDGAVVGEDYEANAGTLRFEPGEVEMEVAVVIHDDDLDEFDERFGVVLDNAKNATLLDPDAEAEIVDNDAAPTVRVDDAMAVEGDGVLRWPVTLSDPSGRAVSVRFESSDDSATADDDYVSATGTLTFDPGVTSLTIDATLVDDAVDEVDETIRVLIAQPLHAAIERAEAEGTIEDDDAAPTLVVPDVFVDEDVGPAVFDLLLSGPSARPIEVSFMTSGVEADAGADFDTADGVVTFAPGETAAVVIVTIQDDSDDEPPETFRLDLSDAVNVTLPGAAPIATIRDDDRPNRPPEPVDDQQTVLEGALTGAGLAVDVLGNDSDPDADALRLVDVTAPAGFTAFIDDALTPNDPEDDVIRVIADEQFNGVIDLTYRVGDGQLFADAALRLTVAPDNDRPVADPQSVDVVAGDSVEVTLSGSDVETAPGALDFAIDTGPAHGTLTALGPGRFRYEPTAPFTGPDQFTFTVTDDGDPSGAAGNALTSLPAMISIGVLEPPLEIMTIDADRGTLFPDRHEFIDLAGLPVSVRITRLGEAALGLTPPDGDGRQRLVSIELTGTSADASRLIVSARHGTTIDSIEGDGGMRLIDLRHSDLVGNTIVLGGALATLKVDDIAEGSHLRFGGERGDRLSIVATGTIGRDELGAPGTEGVDLEFPGEVRVTADAWHGGAWQIGAARRIRIVDGDFSPTVEIADGFDLIDVRGGDLRSPVIRTGVEGGDGDSGRITVRAGRDGTGGALESDDGIEVDGNLKRVEARHVDADVIATGDLGQVRQRDRDGAGRLDVRIEARRVDRVEAAGAGAAIDVLTTATVADLGRKPAVGAIRVTGADLEAGLIETQPGTRVGQLFVTARRGRGGNVDGTVTVQADQLDRWRAADVRAAFEVTGHLGSGRIGRVVDAEIVIGGAVIGRLATASGVDPLDTNGLEDGRLDLLNDDLTTGVLRVAGETDLRQIRTG